MYLTHITGKNFLDAAQKGDLTTIRSLNHQIDIRSRVYSYGEAIRRGHLVVVQYLEVQVESLYNPSYVESLIIAATAGKIDMVKYFTKKLRPYSYFRQAINVVFPHAMWHPDIMLYFHSLGEVELDTIDATRSMLSMVVEDISGISLATLNELMVS